MADSEVFRFKIGAYTPDTMPMSRLAEYMAELSALLGEQHAVHFVELEPGSTTLVHKVEREAVPKIRDRVDRTRRREGPADAMAAQRAINRKLREDNTDGVLTKGTAEILEFPGRRAAQPAFGAISQEGSLDGVVIKLGGRNDPVPVHIDSGTAIYSKCVARRNVAKRLAEHLFTSELRVKGTGRWHRDEFGNWALDHFTIADFEILDAEPLTSVVAELRAIPGAEWGPNAWADIVGMRDDAVPH